MANGMFSEDAAAYFANPFRMQDVISQTSGAVPTGSSYSDNPFRMQDAINQANLTALLKQKEAEVAQQRLGGMLLGGIEGPAPGLTQSQIDFLTQETPAARDARVQQFQKAIPTLFTLLGLPNFSSLQSVINAARGLNSEGMAVSPSTLSDPTIAYSGVTDFSYDGDGGGVGPSETGSVNVNGVDVGYGGEYG